MEADNTQGDNAEAILPLFPAAMPPWTRALRPWQQRGLASWQTLRDQGRRDVLVTACPGAGKTTLALRAAHLELRRGRCALLVVVVPNRQLKLQWARAAQRVGITLTARWDNAGTLPAGIHGIVVTFAQVARLPESMRLLCRRYRVMAVLDEVHHGGNGRAWGEGMHTGFEHAQARLCLSGTPFRSDRLPLPFVRYDAQGRAQSDITYSYAQGLADGAVRPAFFHFYGGRLRWKDGQGARSATFDDPLGDVDQARRLRSALSPTGGWLTTVLRDAALDLAGMRQGHGRAKGLVVCTDAAHARAVSALLQQITGETPTLALSDDPGSAEALERFRGSEASWLVVCRLAGEGFDCADLRVCVWASVICAELYFRQILGRIIRMMPGLKYQDATCYLPADPRLMALAASILEEPSAGPERELRGGVFAPPAAGDLAGSRFQPVSSEATGASIITGGELIAAERLEEARALKAARPGLSYLPDHQVAALLTEVEAGEREFETTVLSLAPAAPMTLQVSGFQEAADILPQASAEAVHVEIGGTYEAETLDAETFDVETFDEKLQRLRKGCTLLSAQLALELNISSKEVYKIYRTLLGFAQTRASLAQLEQKHDLLRRKLAQLRPEPSGLVEASAS